MTWIAGIIGAAVLFAVLAVVKPAGGGCANPCVGCTGGGACRARGAAGRPHEEDHA